MKAKSDSAQDYESNALPFLSARDASIINADAVGKWSQTLGRGANVIELGAGGGYPVTQRLKAEGLNLWAMDGSPTLVKTFQSRFPTIPVQCTRVQEFDYFNRAYDAAIAIGLIFLLSEADQVDLISRVSKVLVDDGRFLFTAPIQACEWTDNITGTPSLSLGRVKYEQLFGNAGFQLKSVFKDDAGNNYYDFART